ncbi:MAG: hypothetical protein V4488_26705 [Pseudomonadota bacterium]
MTWEYRVMNRGGELAIYEVYYGDNGTVEGYSSDPTYPAAATMDALRENCRQYLASLEKPVIPYEEK